MSVGPLHPVFISRETRMRRITLSLLTILLAFSTSLKAQVLDLVQQAQARENANQWAEAAELWTRIVKQNPVQPAYWFSLGNARYRAGDCHGAVPAYQRAAELGAPIAGAYNSWFALARCHAISGSNEKGVQALKRAYELGYPNYTQMATDPNLASLRTDPRIVKMLRLYDVSRMKRVEGWRHDLAILADEVHRKGFNPNLYVNRTVTREDFDAHVVRLSKQIPRLSDGQIVLELQKLMAFLGDGHTAVWDGGENPLFHGALPLRLFWFEEGLFVTAASPAYQELLGAQVITFDGLPADSVLRAMDSLINRDRGNPQRLKMTSPYKVRWLAMVHAAGLIKQPDRVTLTVQPFGADKSTRDVVVQADSVDTNIWNMLPAPNGWVTFASTLPSQPLYVRNMGTAQWFEYLAPQKTVYFQFNRVGNGPQESLADFTTRLMKFIDEHEVDRLIIDMRWNNGGNTYLAQNLLLALLANTKVNQPGKLFVILGRRTYSAAQNFSTYMERFTAATFVGEPTGSSPNFVGEESPITLPYSKVRGNVSDLFWESSWPHDQRIWLAPQIYVAPTFKDFSAGRDAALEAIIGPESGPTSQ